MSTDNLDADTDPRIQAQLQALCNAGVFRRKPRQLAVLRGLLSTQATDRFNHGESGSAIAEDIYKGIHGPGFYDLGDPAGAAKHIVDQLRTRLKRYYDANPNDAVIISIPARTYQPSIKYRHETAGRSETSGTTTDSARLPDFEYIGKSKEALRYLIQRIPSARRLEDTTVRWNVADSLYDDMQDYIEALRHSDASFRSITGPVQDEAQVKALYAAYANRPDGSQRSKGELKCFRLHHTAPLMNFILIYDKDKGHPEVLFGYGTQRKDQLDEDTPVFRSNNPLLVKEFQRLFKELRTPQFSRKIGVEDPEFLRSRDRKCDVLATFATGFPDPEIEDRIRNCRAKIVICTTAWPKFDFFKPFLKQALKNGCSVDFSLWHEDSEFVKLRSGEMGDAEDLKRSIQANKVTLQAFRNEANFRVHWCSGQGSVTIFWFDDLIYFSPYWAGVYASTGPHFLVHADSEIGRHLQEQYNRMLHATPPQATSGGA